MNLWDFDMTQAEAELLILPVPWEATVSYGAGTADGPAAVLQASAQLDFSDREIGRDLLPPVYMLPIDAGVRAMSDEARAAALKVIDGAPDAQEALAAVNALSPKLNEFVRAGVAGIFDAGKIPAVLGGDHSVPLGAFREVARREGEFGILHFDAHLDLREAYEGFRDSHASIMYNALVEIPELVRLTQVAIRDYSEEEQRFMETQGDRVRVYWDHELKNRAFEGQVSWRETCDEIVATLPEKVWVSFDIDGLDPRFCPHTGTPVPGGIEFAEAVYLVKALARSGRRIIGFDLVEVSPPPGFAEDPEAVDEWDANVGMRLLYKLCMWTLRNRGLV